MTLATTIATALDTELGVLTDPTAAASRISLSSALQDALDTYFIHADGSNGPATPTVRGAVKIDATAADPIVYLKSSTDTLLALKAPLTGVGASGTWPVSITGNAATLTGFTVQASRDATDWNTRLTPGLYNADASPANSVGGYAHLIVAMSNDTGLQIAGGYNNDNLWFRGWYSSGAGFTPWRLVLHDGNYNGYVPTLTGGGASGTWGISISGNAATSTTASGVSSGASLTLGTLTVNNNINVNQAGLGYGLVGVYDPTKYRAIYAMGAAYQLAADGSTLGTLYGTFFSYDNTSAPYANITGHALGHGFGVANAGVVDFYAGGGGVWTSGTLYAAASVINGYSVAKGDGGSYSMSITGNAANINNYAINQNVATTSGPTFVDVYNNGGWFRNTGDIGLYSTTYGIHFYADSLAHWNMTSATTNGALVMRAGYASTIKGYLYWDSSGFGLLSSAGGWAVMVAPGGGSGTLTGTWTTAGDQYENNYYVSSSRKLKQNIRPLDFDPTLLLMSVEIRRFELKSNPLVARIGFIAEDTHPLLSGENQKHFDYGNSIAVLIATVQRLHKRITELEDARH